VTVAATTLVAAGAALMLLAGIGILRFPDTLVRTNAATKAAGLGVACVLAGAAFAFGTVEAGIKLGIAVLLQFATAPVSGHVIGRAAHRAGVPLWSRTRFDDLRDSEGR
jgi:multicomponent Na+:H+ antiporter subunit G